MKNDETQCISWSQAAGSEDVLHQHVHPSLRTAFREIHSSQVGLLESKMYFILVILSHITITSI